MEKDFEKMYDQKFERLYEQRLAEGKERISKEINGQIFFTPGTSGQAYAARVQTLKEELERELLSTR